MTSIQRIIAIIFLAMGVAYTSYIPNQNDFIQIFIGYSLAFGSYFYLMNHRERISLSFILGLAIIPVFSVPNLSDDIYRFIWDGYCTINGLSPYQYLPREVLAFNLPGLDNILFQQLNSPDYYAIYPTISQLFFGLATTISSSFESQVILLKCIYVTLHIVGSFAAYNALQKTNQNPNNIFYYAANPLVLIEGIGNLHAEINMISCLFLAFYLYKHNRKTLSAFFFAAAIAIKITPILLCGYFLFRYKNKIARNYLILIAVFTTILFIPIIIGLLQGGFLESIDLYFRKFEFNGSIYYLLRFLGQKLTGYNQIQVLGPLLFLLFFSFIIRRWWLDKTQCSILNFTQNALLVWTIYFFISTTIHPWYIISLLGFTIILPVRFVLLWSYVITLTYINYSYPIFHENLWIVALEYTIVFLTFAAEYKYDLSIKDLDGHSQ